MKFVSFKDSKNNERLGLYINENIFDLQQSAKQISLELPDNMDCFLNAGEAVMDMARKVQESILAGDGAKADVNGPLLAPVPHPPSCRDGYAFRQHVATARRNRGVEMIPEFDQYPVFYFTNHNAVLGEGDVTCEADHMQKLDFELEAAIVIGKKGRNINSGDADSYIAGYTIMNDLSARVLQMEEMKLNLGPAKGKDFATTIGPWLVTPDELESALIKTEHGAKYDLRMTAKHNGKLISDGNIKDMNWSFAEIIERASYGVDIFPGDVIGSGTVGTGCYLELNGTAALEAKKCGEQFTPAWLNDGDSIELTIDSLGTLANKIVLNPGGYSILDKKKMAKESATA